MNRPWPAVVVCAPDSFKGTLTAEQAAEAMAQGVLEVWPEVTLRLHPLADGGEGSLAVIHRSAGGTLKKRFVQGPLGNPVQASYLLLSGGRAVVEIAQASGLLLIPEGQRDPEAASTFGVGELIRAALDDGADSVIVCLGGSATTDGGAGMAEALGFRLLDASGKTLPRGGSALNRLAVIDRAGADPRLTQTTFVAATDVTNPLCGPQGAAAIYGPQKGADDAAVRRLDAGLAKLGSLLPPQQGLTVQDLPGSGAAGGLAAGLAGLLGARIESGAEVLMDASGIGAALQDADLCLTGEGRIDAQSGQGKLIGRLARRCSAREVPLIAIGGAVSDEPLLNLRVTAICSASRAAGPPPSGPLEAADRLARAVADACRLIRLGIEKSRS